MIKVAWSSVRHHPVRFLLSALAVLLGVAFVSGTAALSTMVTNTLDGVVGVSVDADVYVQADSDSDSSGYVQDTLADLISQLADVRLAVPDYGGTMTLLNAEGSPVSSGMAPSLLNPITGDAAVDGDLAQGALPSGPAQVALEAATADKAGLKVGDQTKVVCGNEIRDVDVVGIMSARAALSGAVVVYMDEASTKSLFNPGGLVDSIQVYAQSGVSEADLGREVSDTLAGQSGIKVVLGDDLRQQERDAMDDEMGFMTTFVLAFGVVAILVGAFIIANTFTMVVRQELKELATLRAVGASPSQVMGLVLGQAAFVGLLGSVVGVLAGFGLVVAIREIYGLFGMEMQGGLPITAVGVVASLVGGIAVAVLAALPSARRAARIPPVEALRGDQPEARRSRRQRAVAGAALVAIGICLIVAAWLDSDRAGWWMLGGAVGLLVGSLLAGPGIAPAVTRVLAWPLAKVFDPTGRLARGNVARNPRRTANTAAALVIGMALVGAATVMAASAQSSLVGLAKAEIKATLVVSGPSSAGVTASIPSAAVQEIGEVPGIEARPWRSTPARLSWQNPEGVKDSKSGQVTLLWIASPELLAQSVDFPVVEGSSDGMDNQLVAFEQTASDEGLHVGDSVDIVLAPNSPLEVATSLTVGEIVHSDLFGTGFIVSESWLEGQLAEEARDQLVATPYVFVNVDDASQTSSVEQQLQAIVDPFYTITVGPGSDFASAMTSTVSQLLTLIYALLSLSILIAVLGVVNTLILSVAERTRETGLLRAIGLGRGQVTGMIMVEAILISLFGTLIGLAVGVAVSSCFPRALSGMGLDQLTIPWATLVLALPIAILIGVIASLIPARRAAKTPILEAIAYE
jgi:putative ABC transport system permease protein